MQKTHKTKNNVNTLVYTFVYAEQYIAMQSFDFPIIYQA